MTSRLVFPIGAALALASMAAGMAQPQPALPRFTREIAWSGKGVWLKADTHTHTRFSDGANSVPGLVTQAVQHGCDVVAITDHTDRDSRSTRPEYFAAIDEARKANPRTVIVAGVEWNLPPWDGEEHATVLVHPAVETKLAEFKERFDDLKREPHSAALAADGLRWLAANMTAEAVPPVVMYEHPSRRAEKSLDIAAKIKTWRAVNDLVIGFAGAPGHQGDRNIGSYKGAEKTIDRWDPAAARVGDAWDTLLGAGLDVWAAYAPSDFHNNAPSVLSDYWPCEFSETWLYAPSRDAAGVLRALRAGSFFANHGGIAREAEILVGAPGLKRPATAGEAIAVAAAAPLTVQLRFQAPAKAWGEGANRIDKVEIIAVDATGAKIVAEGAPAAGAFALTHTLATPKSGVVFRARGFRTLADGSRLAFYTNPVRVTAR